MRMLRQPALRVARLARILPHGVHLPSDLKRVFPNFSPGIVFDVGANIGITVKQYLADFPQADVMAFEPDPASFETLSAVKSDRVRCFNIALSDSSGTARFDNSSPVSQIHSIAADQSDKRLPLVELTTIDKFCDEFGIDNIGLFKIDTEGNDLKVLRGASKMLARHSVSVVLAECALSIARGALIPFEQIEKEMVGHGYKFFGFYGQVAEANFALANCAFISPSLS